MSLLNHAYKSDVSLLILVYKVELSLTFLLRRMRELNVSRISLINAHNIPMAIRFYKAPTSILLAYSLVILPADLLT